MKNFLVLVLVLASVEFFGQGSVRGFIKDKETGQAVFPITVGLEGTGFGAQTDISGYYSLTKVPAGKYVLIVQSIEFKTIKEEIQIQDNKVLTKNYMVDRSDVEMKVACSDDKNSLSADMMG